MFFMKVCFVAFLAVLFADLSTASVLEPYCGPNAYYAVSPGACSNICLKNCNTDQVCTADCKSGCSCNEGYVWDDCQGKCVLPCECSNKSK